MLVTAVGPVEIKGWNSLVSACFNINNFSLWTHPPSERSECPITWTSKFTLSLSLSFCHRMPLLHGVLSQVLSWSVVCQVLFLVGTGLGAVIAVWTARLLVRHAWYTHRLSCFSKPHANSWLLGHLGQVGYTQQGWWNTQWHAFRASFVSSTVIYTPHLLTHQEI